MLIHRCPNLEELTVNGTSSLPTNVHTLIDGRWPNLRKLDLGDVSVDFLPNLGDPGQKRPFVEFLEAHPKLETLGLSRFIIQPAHLAALDPGVLQNISTFSGTLQQLQAVPYIYPHLRSVTFRDPMQTREVPAQAVAGLLQGMKKLSKLRIAFTLHSMYDSGNLLRSLIASCPNLRHLELTCGGKPSFQLVSHSPFSRPISPHTLPFPQDGFSKTVRGFPKLRTLHLTIIKYPGDEPLSAGAARIARCNPRLTRFSLTFLPPSQPSSLFPSLLNINLSLPTPSSFLPFPLPSSRATGTFALTCDHHGLPLSLSGAEHEKREWPWGLGVSLSTRRWTRDLRVGRRREGAWWRLVVERSAAGDEMRVMVFCGVLVSLALWGFLVGGNGSGRTGIGGQTPPAELGAVFSRAVMKDRTVMTATM